MTTHCSILFDAIEPGMTRENRTMPAYFGDLNLDQIVDAVTVHKKDYDLMPFFFAPLHSADTVRYRQAISQDLENGRLLEGIKVFAERMTTMRRYLALSAHLTYHYHIEGWFLEAVIAYCEAVTGLAHEPNQADLRSTGLLAFREYVDAYTRSEGFAILRAETQSLKADLATIQYCVVIKGLRVQVRKYESEVDYSSEIEAAFGRFKQGAPKDYRSHLTIAAGMGHVEAQILDLVAKLYPDIFSHLDQHYSRNTLFVDETVRVFDREVQFYVAYLDYIEKAKRAGLLFCYPEIDTARKEVYNYDGFDLALAQKLIREELPIICNDFYLRGQERIFVVTGPNQGGKTTFARTFGQLHYLASIGCPVPGSGAQLYLYDELYTHFEREEDIRNLRGKLEDDLLRIHQILKHVTADSIIILNEIFTSTTLEDAILLGKQVMATIADLDALCVYVTFLDELASLNEKTVSVVSTVVPDCPSERTFRIIRKPADGLAYALSIAEKHRLTYRQLIQRIAL